ncbi:MAG: hypothetical protein ACHQZR_02285, partial [Candidatus Limnocylindrales bacterium]
PHPLTTADADAGPGQAALLRLEAVRQRLAAHARSGAHAGLTGADPRTGERWDAGQVWAHLAEFPAYWVGQFQRLGAAGASGGAEPPPFGRTAADPGRIAAIERDRAVDPAALHARVDDGIRAAETWLGALPSAGWALTGRHPTLGVMVLPAMVQRFLVDHLEEHAAQLDDLARPPDPAGA